jgi:cell division protein FtsB
MDLSRSGGYLPKIAEILKMTDRRAKREAPSKAKFLRLDPEQRRRVWQRARYAGVALVLLVLIAIIFGGQSGFIAIYRYSRYEKMLEKSLDSEKAVTDSLQNVLMRLRTDSDYRERAAREKLRMIEDGEMIFRFEEGTH